MGYEKIHACQRDCILYRKEYKDATSCPICTESRWKKKKNSDEDLIGTPAKVLWYMPIATRFLRLFQNSDHAKKLTWHASDRVQDGKMCHPADSPAWQKVDSIWLEFKKEPRHLWLGLCKDGINPHSSQSSRYICWPVIAVIYNLPPWLCMKRRFMLLSMLIPGQNNPRMTSMCT